MRITATPLAIDFHRRGALAQIEFLEPGSVELLAHFVSETTVKGTVMIDDIYLDLKVGAGDFSLREIITGMQILDLIIEVL